MPREGKPKKISFLPSHATVCSEKHCTAQCPPQVLHTPSPVSLRLHSWLASFARNVWRGMLPGLSAFYKGFHRPPVSRWKISRLKKIGVQHYPHPHLPAAWGSYTPAWVGGHTPLPPQEAPVFIIVRSSSLCRDLFLECFPLHCATRPPMHPHLDPVVSSFRSRGTRLPPLPCWGRCRTLWSLPVKSLQSVKLLPGAPLEFS